MTKARFPMRRFTSLLFGLVVSASVSAAGGHEGLAPANTQVANKAMLQRGAAMYMNYCAGCHSLKYLRYSRMAEDLGLTEEQVMENLAFSDTAKFGETINAAMTPKDGVAFFGKAPPDLSLSARSRGVDWVYNYLKSFYVDPTSATGWNNTILANASMPHVLWELQGSQSAHYGEAKEAGASPAVESLELTTPGLLSPAEYDAAVRDLVTFLEYAAEPAILQRQAIGVWVLLYLALFTLIAWLLKQEYWKDVH
jgi:ubiquinol-cytochrome c reductase cytochrome c1 subunit